MRTDPAAVELVCCPCMHCCCPGEEAGGWIYLPCAQEKNKSALQPLRFSLFWVMCDTFSLLSQPVIWPNPSVPFSGPQDLLGALNKACPSDGVYGRGTGEWQGLHGEEWHQCQWGSFSAISELGVVGNAKLMMIATDDAMSNGGWWDGEGRKGSTYRCEQSNQSERSQFLCFWEKYITPCAEHFPVGYMAREIFKETDSEGWPCSYITYTHGLFQDDGSHYPKGTTSASDYFCLSSFPVFLLH